MLGEEVVWWNGGMCRGTSLSMILSLFLLHPFLALFHDGSQVVARQVENGSFGVQVIWLEFAIIGENDVLVPWDAKVSEFVFQYAPVFRVSSAFHDDVFWAFIGFVVTIASSILVMLSMSFSWSIEFIPSCSHASADLGMPGMVFSQV